MWYHVKRITDQRQSQAKYSTSELSPIFVYICCLLQMGAAADYVSRTRIGAYFHESRESRQLVLLIVAIALLLDNMLLTTVGKSIPIIFVLTPYKLKKMAVEDAEVG